MSIKTEDNEQVRVLIPREALREVDRFVKEIPNMKRTQLLSNLILMGLDDVKFLNSVGLLKASRVARAICQSVADVYRAEKKEETA